MKNLILSSLPRRCLAAYDGMLNIPNDFAHIRENILKATDSIANLLMCILGLVSGYVYSTLLPDIRWWAALAAITWIIGFITPEGKYFSVSLVISGIHVITGGLTGLVGVTILLAPHVGAAMAGIWSCAVFFIMTVLFPFALEISAIIKSLNDGISLKNSEINDLKRRKS